MHNCKKLEPFGGKINIFEFNSYFIAHGDSLEEIYFIIFTIIE